MKAKILLLFIFTIIKIIPAEYKILESNDEFLKIEFNFSKGFTLKDTLLDNKIFTIIKGGEIADLKPGDPWLPYLSFNFGIPFNSASKIEILEINKTVYKNKFVIPFQAEDPSFNKVKTDKLNKMIYLGNKIFPELPAIVLKNFLMRFINVVTIRISPFQFSPVSREIVYNNRIVIKLTYNPKQEQKKSFAPIKDVTTENFVNSVLINKNIATKWIGRTSEINTVSTVQSNKNWYNPNTDYYKIFVKDKGVYRITFDQLVAAGVPISSGIPLNKLALYNNGEIVPIDIKDNGDLIFNSGDYFQFVGYPPQPSPYCKLNIYNTENVYWFTYENSDTTAVYKNKDGSPQNWTTTIDKTIQTLHYERDTIYERLGYAPDGKRDFWFWGGAQGAGGTIQNFFTGSFDSFDKWFVDSNKVKLRVNLHGITDNAQHKVEINITSQPVDSITWFNQTEATLETEFSVPSIHIYPTNNLQVLTRGDVPTGIDDIRVNWFEFDYWRTLTADNNNFSFGSNPEMIGAEVFSVKNWMRNNVKVYIPQRSEMITNVQYLNNNLNEILFKDSLTEQREYFCVADDYFLSVDSISQDQPSDLRNLNNGADYIIIYHGNFINAAKKLADYRASHLYGFSNPRIKLVDVKDIYDEFSFGLQDPFALKAFALYTFQNWQSPAPSYICLLGDMSWDYRHILPNSRPNFIASIPYQQTTYGQAVADNNIVAFDSTFIPQMAIGRLSCETTDEAGILVDKIINYPADNGRDWKRNELLIGAGENDLDEALFNFNEENITLEKTFINAYGYTTSKVFRYPNPNSPDQQLYAGAGPEIREKFNEGCVLTNFYGHGGGYQWDLVFLNDDIYLLQNGNRLPMIMSVTCYTAHFDNQDIFGEQFNKVAGKGSIGFWGNTGLTYWNVGTDINYYVNKQIYEKSDFVIGDAILHAKAQFAGQTYQLITDHIAMLSLLGDPALELALPRKPNFRVSADEITLNPSAPLIDNPVNVKVKFDNVGRIFSNDSVLVKIKISNSDTSFYLGTVYVNGFAFSDSITLPWVPKIAGNVKVETIINDDYHIDEEDHSDNDASISTFIFSLQEPNIIKPIDGFSTNSNRVNFLFTDVGYYINQKLVYDIQIDTSSIFAHPVLEDSTINPTGSLVNWQSPPLPSGYYYWRAKINFNNAYSNWTGIRAFTIENAPHNGYYMEGKLLNSLTLDNVYYKDSLGGLILNSSFLPARPSNNKLLDTFYVSLPNDLSGQTSITTDGTYIFIASMAYYQTNNKSKIYKIGSGNNGTIKGFNYGEIPGVAASIWHTMFYYKDGFIYVATGDHSSLLKINPVSGDTSRVIIPAGLLNDASQVADGAFYLTSDGDYVYNLAYHDSSIKVFKYILRKFDPSNGWTQLGSDDTLSGTSYPNFVGFFVASGYLYPYENYYDGYMRRINLQNNIFEEEWATYDPFQYFYAWTYDWTNNEVYTSVFGTGKIPRIFKFIGKYKQSTGIVETPEIGPSTKWTNSTYNIKTQNSSTSLIASLYGLNANSNKWDTLLTNLTANTSLSNYPSDIYPYMKMRFSFKDTTFNSINPNILKNINIEYLSLPELYLDKPSFTIIPDTLLQGLPVTLNLGVHNAGFIAVDTASINFYLDNSDSSFYKTKITNIAVDSTKSLSYIIPTATLTPASMHSVKAIVDYNKPEFYKFNNSLNQTFLVTRDSLMPTYEVTFDGKEIINGDIVSSKPVIMITVKDNSPISLDTTMFSLSFNNSPLYFNRHDIDYKIIPYPNSQMTIKFTPILQDGTDTLDILGKNDSGYLDTVSHVYIFNTFSQPDLLNVFNYPNPFRNDTYFTFELHGAQSPDEFKINIFTVAGRLIRAITLPSSGLRIGFNKIYWDGRDEDGNVVANGVYFYKIVCKNNGVLKTIIQKLAKIK
jgi:hypothetical protein